MPPLSYTITAHPTKEIWISLCVFISPEKLLIFSITAINMMRLFFGWIFVLGSLPFLWAQQQPFVRVADGHFVEGDRTYRFLGTNLWYAMNLGAASESDRARLVRELDRLQAMGVQNIRLMAATEGTPLMHRLSPTSQPAAGKYDEQLLLGLDFTLAEMAKRDMKAVLCLNNFFAWSGGMSQYVAWATQTEIPFPDQQGHTWDEYQRYAAQFYTNAQAKALYKKYVRMLLKRRNQVNGRRYKKDPTIMAWQLANEPREYGQADAYIDWVDKTARFIHRKDKKHLVSIGSEGKVADYAGSAWEQLAHNPHIDYLTLHLWVENWSWYNPKQAEMTFDSARIKASAYISKHLEMAKKAGKPLVLEEFGIGRDHGSMDPAASVQYRNRYDQEMLDLCFKAKNGHYGAAGANVWSWAGEAMPVEPGAFWQPGQPFGGDPPHERQGWYSVFLSDQSTIDLLKQFARQIAQAGAPDSKDSKPNLKTE